MFVFNSTLGMHVRKHAQTQTETLLYIEDVLIPESFILEFLDILVLGFGATCTICLQVVGDCCY